MLSLLDSKIVCCAAVSSLLAASAYAEDFDVTANIDRVTVFSVGAEVTRTGTVSIAAGEHRLIFSELPPNIDPARLQLTIGSNQVSLGNLQLEESHQGELVSAEEQRLQQELEDLLFNRQAIVDEVASADTQLKLLDSLAAGNVGGPETALDGAALSTLLETLATSSNAARQVIRNANQRLRSLDREIEQKRFEIAQVATRQRSQQVLTVSVEAASAVTTDIAFTYPVNRARWTWLYEARLDTDSRYLELHRKVSVAQTTGENWEGVELTITTARPNQNTQTPELGSLLVDIDRPQPVRRARAESAAPPSLAFENGGLEEIAVTGDFLRRNATVVASQYLVDFQIPGRVSIDADSQPQILPIDQRGLTVKLITRVVPELDTNAYLEARFTHEESEPLQAGIMQLYRDGSFIGRSGIAEFLPMEEVRLPFGRDDRVRVEIRAEQQESREGGTFRRSTVDNHRVRYELTSFHDRVIEVEILARLPVSQNAAIEVELDDLATPFDEEDVDGNTGVVLWNRQLEPTQTIELRHYYSVSYPRNDRLYYQDN